MTNCMKRTKRNQQKAMWDKLSTVTPHRGFQTTFDNDISSLYPHTLAGLKPGELVVFASSIGMGKSVIDFESN